MDAFLFSYEKLLILNEIFQVLPIFDFSERRCKHDFLEPETYMEIPLTYVEQIFHSQRIVINSRIRILQGPRTYSLSTSETLFLSFVKLGHLRNTFSDPFARILFPCQKHLKQSCQTPQSVFNERYTLLGIRERN